MRLLTLTPTPSTHTNKDLRRQKGDMVRGWVEKQSPAQCETPLHRYRHLARTQQGSEERFSISLITVSQSGLFVSCNTVRENVDIL